MTHNLSLTGVKTEDDDDDLCPICAETMDATDKEFFPCPCGFQFCCFCYNRMAEVGDHFRCPACRKPFGDAGSDDENGGGGGDDDDATDSDADSDVDETMPAPAVVSAWGR